MKAVKNFNPPYLSNMTMKILTTLILSLMIFSGVSAQDYLELQYQLNKGDQFEIDQQANQETYLTVNDIPKRTSSHTNAVLLLTVQELSTGKATLKAEYKKIALQSSQDELDVSVNTETPAGDVYNKLFKAFIGKPFTITMEENGTIDKVSGLSAIFDQMINAVEGVEEKDKPELKAFLEDHLGAEQIKANLSMVLPYYPAYKVRTGDSWSSHLATDGFYNGDIDNYWKLTYGTQYMVKLKNTGKFGTNASEVVDLGDGQQGRMDLNGELKGQYAVNPKTGWPTLSIVHTELTGKYTYFIMKGKRKKKKKTDLEVPVKILKNISYKVKHL